MNTLLLRFALVVVTAFAAAPLVMPQAAFAQADDLVLRLNRAEQQVRQLTGQVEELQYRNQQLENQLRAMGGAPQQQGAVQPPQQQPLSQPPQVATAPMQPQISQPPVTQPPVSPGSRGDAFDPSRNPNAPGVPRTLGGSAPAVDEPDVGAPGGRAAGAPLDLSTMGSAPPVAVAPMQPQMQPPMQQPPLPQPGLPPRTAGVSPTLPPSQTPKDEYDLGYGYVLRKDYALAEETLRGFLQKYPSDPMAAEAQYWLGESLFQRQRYRDAAESFLKVTTGYGNNASKGAEGLLRLGQSLAALKEREAACAAFGEVNRKYPRAPASVKQGVEREQKRARC